MQGGGESDKGSKKTEYKAKEKEKEDELTEE